MLRRSGANFGFLVANSMEWQDGCYTLSVSGPLGAEARVYVGMAVAGDGGGWLNQDGR